LIASQAPDHPSVRKDEANIRKAFDRHSIRDVSLFIGVNPDEYTPIEERLHPFILEGVFFHANTRGAPLGIKIKNDGLSFPLCLCESFIKQRKSGRE
jgi:hypothetical protein